MVCASHGCFSRRGGFGAAGLRPAGLCSGRKTGADLYATNNIQEGAALAGCDMKLIFAVILAAMARAAEKGQASDEIAPPAMPHRDIAPPKDPPQGETVNLVDGETAFALFLPAGWKVPPTGETALTVHFHGAVWFAIDEHLRHGLRTPLIAAYLGEGSSVYQKPFADRGALRAVDGVGGGGAARTGSADQHPHQQRGRCHQFQRGLRRGAGVAQSAQVRGVDPAGELRATRCTPALRKGPNAVGEDGRWPAPPGRRR